MPGQLFIAAVGLQAPALPAWPAVPAVPAADDPAAAPVPPVAEEPAAPAVPELPEVAPCPADPPSLAPAAEFSTGGLSLLEAHDATTVAIANPAMPSKIMALM